MRRRLAVWLCLGALAAPAGSGADPLRVFAAASLAEPFRALEAAWHGPPLQLQLAASSTLAVQILEGAPADVIATADQPTMQRLVDAARVEAPQCFARNRLVIAVEHGNPKQVARLADLAREDLLVVLAAPEVPAGRYARQMLDGAGVRVAPRSLEESVKAVLNKVVLGEADAGIVYASDVRSAGDRVQAIAVPEAAGVDVSYWIAVLRASQAGAAARDFVTLVLSRTGHDALVKAGFSPP